MLLEYAGLAFSVWLVGFIPMAEIYVAVPAGFALGLDPVSVVVWSVFGNYVPVVLIELGYGRLRRVERIGRWLDRLVSERVKARLDRHGFWFLALATPWIGVWIVAATARVLGADTRLVLVSTFVGILGYAVVIAGLIVVGIGVLG